MAASTARPARPARLLDDVTLESSSVAANCAMNRERQLAGVNSYARELGFNPLHVMRDTAKNLAGQDPPAAWLDLCCGTGRALIQAATRLCRDGLAQRTTLAGVDLVDAFDPLPGGLPNLRLVCSPVSAWTPALTFDLITCVHGLHYIGDKLAAIARAASWLTPDGQLIADLDLDAIVVLGAPQARRRLARRLREAGFSYDSRKHRITFAGGREVRLPYRYIGADDQAGPGYTGQLAVASYYEEATGARQAPGR